MIKILIEKELKAILLSPKFIAVFAVCSILIILSIYVGIQEYNASLIHYDTLNAQLDQQMKNETNWMGLRTGVNRLPDPMQIFVSGINNDIGRSAPITQAGTIKLYNSNYSENTVFAVFRSMDLMFIVQIVLSLFAILFTYDAINGEREAGTLKLNFANPIPRSSYIIAKLVGSWLGLVIPLLIPMLLGIAMVLLYKIPMTTAHWFQLGMLFTLAFLYFTFFMGLGLFLSSLTRGASSSFLYLLVIWVTFVLIIPRAGVMIAGQFIPVPTAAEISSKLSQKSREIYEEFMEWQKKRSKELYKGQDFKDLSPEERQARTREILDGYMKEIREEQDNISQKIAKYDAYLNEDWRNRKAEREKLGFLLSRLSPASSFQLAAMDVAGTGISLKTGYEDQMRAYSDIFNKFTSKKAAEKGNSMFKLFGDDNKREPLDISEVPKFRFINPDLSHILQSAIIDVGILAFYILITIAGSFIAFVRYDVR